MLRIDVVSKLLAINLGLSQYTCAQEPRVQLGNTTIIGREIPTFQQEFFGNIPYADPPLGELRFARPVPKFTLSVETFDASAYGPSCPHQALSYVNEDCLTLNVLRPTGLTNQSRIPVMVWIHGGGFYEGSAATYNGSYIVAHSVTRGTPVIFINLDYRIGALGFPQGIEATRRKLLNLGLRDQLAALAWVQTNIGNFGGDKNKVTIFGESAGSVSVAALLLSPDFGRLAHGAIMMSGSSNSPFIFPGERRENLWQILVSAVPECNGVSPGQIFECLRKANSSTIFAASEYVLKIAPEWFPFSPNVDGPDGLIPDLPSKLFKRGHFSRIPFIAGTCLDEGTIFTPTTFNSTELLRQWLLTNTTPSYLTPEIQNQVVGKLLELYPDIPSMGCPFNTGNETFGLNSQFKRAAALGGDFGLHALRRLLSKAAASVGIQGYGFVFADPQPQLLVPAYLGVPHGADLQHVFGTAAITGSGPVATLSRNIMDYWISFSVSLNPNDKHGNATRTQWDMYTPNNEAIMSLNSINLTMIPDNYRAEQMDYINSEPAVLIFRH